MTRQYAISTAVLALATLPLATGCFTASDFINPDFLQATGVAASVANLPDEAPGLLVTVENQTDRAAAMDVSYRESDGNVVNYSVSLNSGDKSARMVVCPVQEITLGNVADLTKPGARIALVPNAQGSQLLDAPTIPYVDVEAFGVLLREGINYDCGDSLMFVVRPSRVTRSGYETIAFFRRSAVSNPISSSNP